MIVLSTKKRTLYRFIVLLFDEVRQEYEVNIIKKKTR